MFIQEFYSNIHHIDTSVPRFSATFRGRHIIVTLDLISKVLHVPRVVLPNYPNCDCLQTVSRDELMSHFCETPSTWGRKQNTPRLGFAKGLSLLNMVMTVTLTPLSHNNSITEPRACFLFSLLEDLSFLTSPLISSLLSSMSIRIRRPVISSSFLRLSRGSFATFPFPFPFLLTTPPWVSSTPVLFGGVRLNFD